MIGCVAGATLLALPGYTAAESAALNCEPANPDQVAEQSRKQAIAAEAVLARLRGSPPTTGLVIQIEPAEHGDDSAVIEAALQRARLVREETGQATTLEFAPGRYRLRRPIALTRADSGTPDAPLRFAAASDGPVVLTGGIPLAQRPLPAALDALLAAAQRKNVVGYAVPQQFVPSPPFPPQRGATIFTQTPSLFVLQGDRPVWRSTTPDAGFAVEAVADRQPGPGIAPQVTVPLALAQVRREPSLQAGGYWTYDWAYEENQVTLDSSLEKQDGPLMLAMPPLATRYAQAARMRYRLFNGFSFIDRPGEMAYADGALAAYPWPGSAPIEVAASDSLLTIDGAHDIRFDGLALQGARQDVVAISGARNITISNAYVGLAAGSAITIKNSDSIVVDRSVITDVGEYGVAMASDPTMPSGNILISDNIMARNGLLTRSKRSAILLAGHDNVVLGNAISDLPHRAIMFGGLRNLIAGNEIFSVLLETSDSGAIATYYDLSTAYNTITQNYLHDISTSTELTQTGESRQVRGIYFDGWASFTSATNNLSNTEAMPYFINSGFGNFISENIWFLRGGPAGAIYDYSHHRHDAVGQYVFDDPKALKLAACSDLLARFAPAFLRDGKPSGNMITENYNIGGQSVEMPAKIADLQQIHDERTITKAQIGRRHERRRGLADLLELAQHVGAPIGPYLRSADRSAALRSLKYRSRAKP